MSSDLQLKALLAHLHINRGLSFREIAQLVSVQDGDVCIPTEQGEYAGVSKSVVQKYVRYAGTLCVHYVPLSMLSFCVDVFFFIKSGNCS